MPAYAYRCPRCAHEIEVLKRMEDAGSVEFCPESVCSWQSMDRIYDSPPAAKVAGGTPRFHHRKQRA